MPLLSSEPAILSDPVAPGILRHSFHSPFDDSIQTFLLKDFRSPQTIGCPLVVIFLHGAASHEGQGMTSGIYANAFGKWAQEFARREAIYVCPEYRGGSWMGPAAESDLLEILGSIREHYAPSQVILLGGSMGGTSALIFASRHASMINGVIALCPASEMKEMHPSFPEQFEASYGGSPEGIPEEYRRRSVRNDLGELASLPLVIVHGTDDRLIPIHHSRLLVKSLVACGARLNYIEIEGGDHDAPIPEPLLPLLDFVLQS